MAAPVLTIDGTNQTSKILDKTLRLGRNTLDVTLIDPTSNLPALGDNVTLTNPTWAGDVTTITIEDRGYEGHEFWTLICTNEDELTLAAGGSLSDATNDYRNLSVTTTLKDGSTEVRGSLETFESGHLPGHTFELTSATHGYTNEEFTIQEVNIEWFTTTVPLFKITFGDEMVTLSAWAQSEDAGVLPITTTKITDGAVTTPKVAANAITANEIASGAITTAKLNASAVIALVTNSGATVVIDGSGITIEDGALVIKDEWGYTSLGASGFDGSWADVVQTGLYNGLFLQGVNGTIANGRTADLPYWTASIESGSTPASYDSTNKYVTFNFPSATNSAALLSDRVTATGGGYYAVECTVTQTAASSSDVLTLGGLLFCYDQDGSFISSVQSLTLPITSSSLSTTIRVEGTAVALPDDTRYVRVQLVAVQTSGTSGAAAVHDVTLKAAPAVGLDDLQVTVNTLTVTNDEISTNIRGCVLIPFAWTGTLPGSSTQDLDIFDSGFGIPQMRMPFDGSVIAVCVALATARTGGTLTARAYNGSSSTLFGPTATIDGTTTNNDVATGDIDDATFDAENFLRLRVTTSSFTPTSNTVLGYLVVQYKVE